MSFLISCNKWCLVRLVDGRFSDEGRVEMLFQGQWGTVSDYGWNANAARIVCHQLGYNLSVTTNIHTRYRGKPGTGPIWLDYVRCSGSEKRLDECSHKGWGEHKYGHDRDVWVQCFNSSQPEGN